MPEMGHTRADLTARLVKFRAAFSYLIAYDPTSEPLTYSSSANTNSESPDTMETYCRVPTR